MSFSMMAFALSPNLYSGEPRTQDQEFECLKEKASTAANAMGESGKFLNDAFEFMQKTGFYKPLMAIEAQRVNLAKQLVGSMAAPGKPLHRVEVDAQGNRNQIFTLVKQMSKNWKDKEKVSEIVNAICESYHPRVARFCVDSFWKKQENVEAFLKAHEQKINELSEDQPGPSETWNDKIRGYDFERDTITDSNLRFGFSTTIGVQDVHKRLSPLGGLFGMPQEEVVLVRNKENQPVGALMMVITNGSPKYYFAEGVPSSPLNPKFVNPFFFVFGSDSAEEWNSHFEGLHGGLFVDGVPLSEWSNKNS